MLDLFHFKYLHEYSFIDTYEYMFKHDDNNVYFKKITTRVSWNNDGVTKSNST